MNLLTENNFILKHLPCLNYAMTLNGKKCIESCEMTNDTDEDWQRVLVRLEGELIMPSEARIDLLPKGGTVNIDKLEASPDIDKLRELSESTPTIFTVKVTIDGEEVFNHNYETRLLAFDEWPGVNYMPETTAAFVTPNAPDLARVNMETARFLQKLTGSASLDEYQTQDPNRVRAQVASIYEALRSEGLVYCSVPASFEETGQRIRLVDKVLSEKMGTCADLSMLMASCMESIGLKPLLVLSKGHMYVGCWLVDKYFPQVYCDDVSYLSKSIANGINEMVLVEATMLTQKNIAFEDAVKAAENHIYADANDFIMAIDIYRCRMEGIRPLPIKIDGQWQLDGIDLNHTTREVKEQQQYDIPAAVVNRPSTRQEIWERKLLDFSLRNNLINLRLGRRAIPFISFDIDLLEDHLQAKEDYLILPCPVKEHIHPDETGMYQSRLHRDGLEKIVTEGIKSNQLCSYLHTDELTDMLKKLFRDSRTALEENGANTLYLVLGLLKWYENEKSVKPRYAPLLLLPVTLVKKSGNNYVLRVRDEEITFNTTLTEMMRQQYDIHLTGLNPLPEDDSGIDVLKVFSIVRTCLKDHPRWDIVEESLLSLFSFSKFVMWNDIHNNAEKMRQSNVVESLIQKRLVGNEGEADTDTRRLDQSMEPAKYALPVDVDSSQLEAVIESGEGRSFILYGPPGTGKSQTITNMIANALYHNRRVLFVAEKMAALEVVQKRLAKIGLDPFCLEMHSNKMTKSHLLQQLQKALEITRLKAPSEYATESKRLFDQRQELITYIEKLHAKQSSGLSLYDMIIRYLAVETDGSLDDVSKFLEGIDIEKISNAESAIRQLTTVFAITGDPSQHPLKGLEVTDPSGSAQMRIRDMLTKIQPLLPEAYRQTTAFASQNGIFLKGDAKDAEWVEALAGMASKIPELNEAILRIAASQEKTALLRKRISEGKERDHLRSNLLLNGNEGLLTLNMPQYRREWNEACDKWFIPKYFAKKSIVKQLKQYCPTIKSSEVEQLFKAVEEYQASQKTVDGWQSELASTFGKLATKDNEDWEQIEKCIDQAPAILSHIQTTGTPLAALSLLSKERVLGADISFVRQLNALLNANKDIVSLSEGLQMSDAASLTDQWKDNLDMSRDWVQWTTRKAALREAHLKSVITYIEDGHDCDEAADALLRTTYKTLAMNVVDSDNQLQMFNGLIFEETIARYRTLAKQFQELTKKALYCQLASRIPSLTIEASNSSEIGLLKRYIASGGRGVSIRQIVDHIPTLLPKLCPCFLMSPISVAQYIDLDQEKFDIVVFDEASQMPTSEAVGAIARGKAVIVVGDPKQMPPTSFFTTNQVDEEEAENDDMESILDDCITLSMPDHYLTWHYRSRHESLIAFSNSQYYDGKLFTFPSVDDRVSKVSFTSVQGTYDMGRTRSNRSEAQAIVNETIRRLRDKELSKFSIGIVSFSKAQQDLIEDILVDELSKEPKLEALAYDSAEPIFVKNLENVQGDERDVILFSVGYGPDKQGKVSMNFGPLNNQGGERRLNVAVSRARYEMMVFSTLQPEQIDLNRSRAKGVEGLKRFLEFAKNGRMSVSADQFSQQSDTSLIDDVARELTNLGYQVDKQVGRSRFKIDIAVSDPEKEDNYLMGILCDGSNYHSTPTARDREICQPGVLAGLGWNLMRIWSVDWLLNKRSVLNRIEKRLNEIKEERRQGPAKEETATNAPQPSETTKKSLKSSPTAAKLAEIPFSVSASEILDEPTNDLEKEYVETSLKPRVGYDTIQRLSRIPQKLAQDVYSIINVEQPICLSLLSKRIKDLYGMQRVIIADLNRLVKAAAKQNAYRDPLSSEENPIYWKDEYSAKHYEWYRKGNNRDFADIPVIELMNVIKMAVNQQISLPEEDLLRQVTRLLGYTRRTPKTDESVMHALDNLCQAGILERNDGRVTKVEE